MTPLDTLLYNKIRLATTNVCYLPAGEPHYEWGTCELGRSSECMLFLASAKKPHYKCGTCVNWCYYPSATRTIPLKRDGTCELNYLLSSTLSAALLIFPSPAAVVHFPLRMAPCSIERDEHSISPKILADAVISK